MEGSAKDWCAILEKNLPMKLTKFDTIKYHYKSLCDHRTEAMAVTGGPSVNELDEECAINEGVPVFNIMDPYFHFNITRTMEFTGIKFSGLEAAANYTTNHYPPANRIAKKKCEVVYEPLANEDENWYIQPDIEGGKERTGQNSAFAVKRIANLETITDMKYDYMYGNDVECVTSTNQTFLYRSDFRDPEDAATGACPANDADLASVRNSTGEPRSHLFFEKDDSDIFYLRHTVLFNLYNFPGGVGVHPAQFATLNLTNCTFEYFHLDYEALIFAENNAMEVQNFTQDIYPDHSPNLMVFSDDRGANIIINGTTFKHSRFQKGLIVYQAMPKLSSTAATTVIHQGREFWARYPYQITDNPVISVNSSIFNNVAMGLSIEKLSYEKRDTTIHGLDDPDIKYPYFDNHGAVLNSQGFPGAISFVNCTVMNTLPYIPAVRPTMRASSVKPNDLSVYKDVINGQVHLQMCDGDGGSRFFTDYLNSFTEQVSETLTQLENYTPIYIADNEGPMLFIKNTFKNNTAIFGGAVSIDNPNFQTEKRPNSKQQDPAVIFRDNLFSNNQAYLSGNALHVRYTRQRTVTEADEICGGSFYAQGNTFRNNSAIIHSSNGGAVSLECEFVLEESNQPASQIEGSKLDNAMNITEPITNSTYSVQKFRSVIFNNTFDGNEVGQKGSAIYLRQISVVEITKNIFTGNLPGYSYRYQVGRPYETYFLEQRARENTSFLSNEQNRIRMFAASLNSIDGSNKSKTGETNYCYKYFTNGTADGSSCFKNTRHEYCDNVNYLSRRRTNSTLFFTEYAFTNELRQLDCYVKKADLDEKQVNLPQLQGLIYAEACKTCLVSYIETDDTTCSFCLALQQQITIKNNTFLDNYEGLLINKRQTLPRASHVLLQGSINSEISDNVFDDQKGIKKRVFFLNGVEGGAVKVNSLTQKDMLQQHLVNYHHYEEITNLTRYLPQDYDQYQQTPLFHIRHPDRENQAVTTPLNTTFERNLFQGLSFQQPILDEQPLLGALIQVNSGAQMMSQLNLRRNEFIGVSAVAHNSTSKAALIYTHGVSTYAEGNTFQLLGKVDHTIFKCNRQLYLNETHTFETDDILLTLSEWCEKKVTQSPGIFRMTGDLAATSSRFINNNFDFVFCSGKGCIYDWTKSADAAGAPSVLTFEKNTYNHIFGSGGALLSAYAEVDTRLVFRNEHLEKVQRGAYSIEGAPDREIQAEFINLTITESYGDEGAALIQVSSAGGMTCTGCRISNPSVDTAFDLVQIQAEFLNLVNTKLLEENRGRPLVRRRWNDYLDEGLEAAAEADLEDERREFRPAALGNQQGAVNLDNTRPDGAATIYESNDPQSVTLVDCDGSTTIPATTQTVGKDCSVFTNCTFENIRGSGAAASVFAAGAATPVCFIDTKFINNRASQEQATTLVASDGSEIVLEDCLFNNNAAGAGAAVAMRRGSRLHVCDTEFTNNLATSQVGAISVDQGCSALISDSVFEGNVALGNYGAIKANKATGLSIIDSRFERNVAQSILILLQGSPDNHICNSKFIDNSAASITPGFYLQGSTLKIHNTTIDNTNIISGISATDNGTSRFRMFDQDGSGIISADEISDILNFGGAKTEDAVIKQVDENGEILFEDIVVKGTSRRLNNAQYTYDTVHSQTIVQLNQDAMEGAGVISGFFLISSASELKFSNSTMTKTFGSVASAFYVQIGCTMEITDDSQLIQIGREGIEGAVIMAENAKSLLVSNSIFNSNLYTYIRSEGGPTEIANSQFLNGNGSSFVSVKDAGLQVLNDTVFQGNENENGTGLGIQCVKCTNVIIKDTKFDGFLGETGAAVSFSSSCNVDLEDVTFVNSTALQKGAALHVSDSSVILKSGIKFEEQYQNFVYTDSEFFDNQLSKFKYGEGKQNFKDEAIASINFECSGVKKDNYGNKFRYDGCVVDPADPCDDGNTCCIQIDSDTDFARNDSFVPVIPPEAPVPAYPRQLKYQITEDEGAKELDLNKFKGSKAAQELADVLEPKMNQTQKRIFNRQVQGHYEITSGKSFNFNITLLKNNQNIFDEKGSNDTTAKIDFYLGSPNYDQANIRSNLFRATGGVYKFEDMVIVQKPGTTTAMKVEFGYFQLFQTDKRQEIPWLNTPELLVFTARSCIKGEYYTDDFTCELCASGTNTYVAQNETDFIERTNVCEPCLANAYCPDGSPATYPKAGFVRMNADDFLFVKCFNENACLQGDVGVELANCAEGYEGVMCAQCEDGYWSSPGAYQCYECAAKGSPFIFYLVKVFFFAIFCYWISRLLFRSFLNQNQESVAAVRIFMTMSQMLAILNRMEGTISKTGGDLRFQVFMDQILYYMCPDQWIMKFDCLFEGISAQDKYFATLMITICLPPMLLAIDLVLIWILTFLIKLCQFRNPEDMTRLNCQRLCNRIAVAFSMQMFFIYPSIVYTLISSMQCFASLDEKDSSVPLSRMQIIPDISCDTEWYYQVYWAAVVPATICYLIIMPLLVMRSIVLRSHWIFHTGRDQDKLTEEESDRAIATKSSFGFYFSGLSISKLLKRDLTKRDFPIQNSGTFSDENARSRFKVCCQSFKESFLAGLIHPIAGRGALVRITPKHVSKSYFYWEFVVFTEKVILTIVAARFDQNLRGVQLLFAMICLCFFLAIQMHNEPYFTARLNSLHNLTIITQLLYCACRVTMMGLVQLNMGGQVNIVSTENLNIEQEMYENTRGYVDIGSESIDLAIETVFWFNIMCLGFAIFTFLRIMFQHFLFYLIMTQQMHDNIQGLKSKHKATREHFEAEFTEQQLADFKKANRHEEDRCSACRWNHRGCLERLLCICCRKDQKIYDDYKDGPFAEFMNDVKRSSDPDFEQDLIDEELSRETARAASLIAKKAKADLQESKATARSAKKPSKSKKKRTSKKVIIKEPLDVIPEQIVEETPRKKEKTVKKKKSYTRKKDDVIASPEANSSARGLLIDGPDTMRNNE